MYFKKLLKKLCIFNIVTLMSCNLVPYHASSYTIDTIDVPVCGEDNPAIPIFSSDLQQVTVDPKGFTGQNVNLSIKIIRVERILKSSEGTMRGFHLCDLISGEDPSCNLWVRLTAKTKDESEEEIKPAPPNANENTDWIKITNITLSEDEKYITVSADMGKSLMPGDYNVSIILTLTEDIGIVK